jgi:hypothetical protein
MIRLLLALGLILLGVTMAEARPRLRPSGFDGQARHHYHHHRHPVGQIRCGGGACFPVIRDGRPRAWCGWQMRQWFGGGPEYNVARAWARRGTATSPHVGAVVVWPHHVGYITGQLNGVWVVKSGNDGHQVRERPRSLAGVIAVRDL